VKEIVSPYIVAVVVGWLASQLIKAIIAVLQHKRRGIRANLFISGGMPSSHSATIMAIWTTILVWSSTGPYLVYLDWQAPLRS